MKNERLKFWFTVILVASVLGGIFLFMNNRLYVLRMEVDDLSEEAVAQEEVARQLQEDWMLSTTRTQPRDWSSTFQPSSKP